MKFEKSPETKNEEGFENKSGNSNWTGSCSCPCKTHWLTSLTGLGLITQREQETEPWAWARWDIGLDIPA